MKQRVGEETIDTTQVQNTEIVGNDEELTLLRKIRYSGGSGRLEASQ